MTVTIVTAFFNLCKIDNSNRHNRTAEFYFNQGRDILKQDINLVIFTEKEYTSHVENLRKFYLDKTRIVTIDILDLPYFQYIDQVTYNMQKNPIKNRCTIKDTPNYLTLQMNKLYYLKTVIKSNPFKSTHFGWIDLGITHIANIKWIDEDKIFFNIPDQVSLLKLRNHEVVSSISNQEYLSYLRGIVAAGFITGNANYLSWFIDACDLKYKEILDNGWAASEEMLFPLVFDGNDDKFRFYYGDYNAILSNYIHQRTGIDHIIRMIKWSYNDKCYLSGMKFGLSTLDSFDLGKLEYNYLQLAELIYLTYLCAYKIDPTIAEGLLYKYLILKKQSSIFSEHYNNNKTEVISNLKMLLPNLNLN